MLQFLGIHPRISGYDPELERKRMPTPRTRISTLIGIKTKTIITHITSPVENLGSTGISTPFSSKGLNILNTANTLAKTDQMDVSAKYLPTHIRRPNPKAMCSTSLGLSEPSSFKNRSGINACGLGNLDSSCAIDLANRIIKISS